MRILFLSSEVAPFSKTGGLGDVAGALPKALAALGHEVRVATPLYQSISTQGLERVGAPLRLRFPFGEVEVGSWSHRARVETCFVDVPSAFRRDGFYGHPDDARRFAVFGLGALSLAQRDGFFPDVVHGNDWQCGLALFALERGYRHSRLSRALRVFTIHNLAYQGVFNKQEMEALGIPWAHFNAEGVEFYDRLSFMKAALTSAHQVTTVSPSYAKEIQTPTFGVGLDGLLRSKRERLTGILNGVDTEEWSPATDVFLPATYTVSSLERRAQCRAELIASTRLEAPAPGLPLFGVISRMAGQKGADLLHRALPRVLELGASVVVLGSGEPDIENGWRALAARYPTRVALRLGFDTSLAHRIEGGCDFFLMPSRFEPCGLNQMYSLMYGAVPVVHAVGGLKDTVVDFSRPNGNGVVFETPSGEALLQALMRAIELFGDQGRYAALQRVGMAQHFGWEKAARAYEVVYARAR